MQIEIFRIIERADVPVRSQYPLTADSGLGWEL